MSDESVYTAISFAPVQGFIEKSRKLRDLFGASLILSYLSQKIVEKAEEHLGKGSVISPGLIEHQEGMPNRILVKGELTREIVQNTLLREWQKILKVCREWVEDNIGIPKEQYRWSQKKEQIGQTKGEWERWGSYTWEIFIGWGRADPNNPGKNLIKAAMDDLETRKLKRDWVAVNWTGESSSLSGTDAIAWHRLGDSELIKRELKGQLTAQEKQEIKRELEDFYFRLSTALEQNSSEEPQGKFLRPNERLNIPELAKRLVTRYEGVGERLDKSFRIDSFSEMVRLPEPGQSGHWTGWFMGDGDRVGDKLKKIVEASDNVQVLRTFSHAMREWGRDFKRDFPKDLGRVIYAGGDDFLGVIYSKDPQTPISEQKALRWLMGLNNQWKTHGQDITVSVGFVWAGHSVPQRDVLQHCREAEKRAKTLGRDRVTIRVVFNSGQYVQWTCPWDTLDILTKYRDRNGINTQEEIQKGSQKTANWNHLYNDWATLKARHAIRLEKMEGIEINKEMAKSLFDLYFDDAAERFEAQRLWIDLTGDYTNNAIVKWMDDLIQVGWQLCRNSNH